MGTYIVKLGERYVEWSTIVDAPITDPLTREGLADHIRAKYGSQGVRSLPWRMERVDAKGTSSHIDADARDTVEFNRAGPNESRLTFEQLVAWANEEPPARTGAGVRAEAIVDGHSVVCAQFGTDDACPRCTKRRA